MDRLKNYKNIPDEHHIARYCRPKHVEDDQILPEVFELRQDEEYLSCNWMEYFKEEEVLQQIKCVRNAMKNIFKLSSNGKLVRFNVGKTKSSIDSLQIKGIPETQNPSHAGIYSTEKDKNQDMALGLANIIQPENIFSAL